jgi:tetratricopeptide (TPR) repeat protein
MTIAIEICCGHKEGPAPHQVGFRRPEGPVALSEHDRDIAKTEKVGVSLGQVQVAKGSADQAIATYQQSLKDNPHEATFYILMGELYERKQDWGKAKDAYQKALENKPENPLASNNLAYVMMQSGGNLDMALSLARTARRGMPDSPNAADTLGWILYQKGAYQSAVDLFQEALRLGEKSKAPDDATFEYLNGREHAPHGAAWAWTPEP